MKKYLLILIIFFIFFLTLGVLVNTQAASIYKEIFPDKLRPIFGDHLGDFPIMITYEEQLPLAEVIGQSGKDVNKGLEARYEAKTGYGYTIFVGILEMKDKKSAQAKVNNWIDERKSTFAKTWNDQKNNNKGYYEDYEWGKTFTWDIKGHQATVTFASQKGPCEVIGIPSCEFINHGFIGTSVDNYFIYIQSFFKDFYLPKYIDDEAKKATNVVQTVLESFLSQGFSPLPEGKASPPVQEKKEKTPNIFNKSFAALQNLFKTKEKATEGKCQSDSDCKETGKKICLGGICIECIKNTDCKDGYQCVNNICEEIKKAQRQPTAKAGEKKKGTECGDNRCDEWAGENCLTCSKDCYHEGNCCEPGKKYTYLSYFHKKIFQLYDPPAGNIPQGYLIVPKETTKEKMFAKGFNPIICNNEKGLAAECLKDEDCPKEKVCNARSCREAVAPVDVEEIIDREWKNIINQKQKELQTEYLHTYTKFKDNMIIHEQGPGLEISLDVQGTRLGSPLPQATQGEELNALLEIKNVSPHRVAVTAGIVYPGHKVSATDLEEKQYTASFEGSGGLSSLISSFQTKLLGNKYIIMTPGSKFYVQSRVIPQKTGYLKPTAIIYFTSEQYYVDQSLGAGLSKIERSPEEYEQKFQSKEMVKMIEIIKKKCNYWWPICS